MEKIWFYVKNSKKMGPISDEDFLKLKMRGEIHSNTFIWKRGFENWVKVQDLGKKKIKNSGFFKESEFFLFSVSSKDIYGPFDVKQLYKLFLMSRLNSSDLLFSLKSSSWNMIDQIGKKEEEIILRELDKSIDIKLPTVEYWSLEEGDITKEKRPVIKIKKDDEEEFELFLPKDSSFMSQKIIISNNENHIINGEIVRCEYNRLIVKKLT